MISDAERDPTLSVLQLSRSRLRQGLFLAMFVALTGCIPGLSHDDPPDFDSFATRSELTVTISQAHQERTSVLRFVEAGIPGKPLIVFIHGTPGSWRAFQHLMRDDRLRNEAHMFSVDRPGFGGSADFGPTPSLVEQAMAISQLFAHKEEVRNVFLVGHSLGGSIAYQLAADYPSAIDGMLIISSAIDPATTKPRWYNRLAALPVIRSVIPDDLTTANIEMFPLGSQLEQLQASLHKISIPITILQGAKDSLVDTSHVKFAKAQLINSSVQTIIEQEEGHSLIWSRPDLVVTELLKLVNRGSAGAAQPVADAKIEDI